MQQAASRSELAMFGMFKSQAQKSAEASALDFLDTMMIWSNTYHDEGLAAWYQFGFKNDAEAKQRIDITFKIIQIYDACRIINLVASHDYGNYFGQRIGQELKKVDGLARIFQHLGQKLINNYVYAITPVTAISLWIANDIFQVKETTQEQIDFLNFEVESVSFFTLKKLRIVCPSFKFDDKLALKNKSLQDLI
jgi:hypothetical protein